MRCAQQFSVVGSRTVLARELLRCLVGTPHPTLQRLLVGEENLTVLQVPLDVANDVFLRGERLLFSTPSLGPASRQGAADCKGLPMPRKIDFTSKITDVNGNLDFVRE